jgi:hypothetical protein
MDVFKGVQGSGPLGHIPEDNARCHLFANWPNMSANNYPLSGNPPIVSPIAVYCNFDLLMMSTCARNM